GGRVGRAVRARGPGAGAVARGGAAGLAAAGLDACVPDAAVVSVRAPSPEAAVAWARACREAGVAVGCFRPPSTPDRHSRLRLTARGDLTDNQIGQAVTVVARWVPRSGTDG
ncbi:aminotransferase class I/II-fold pyridoxal phosphate-dependent enzyme, partial [Streptomyces sp. NPDC059455]|uniref:aminotransferase class I/II-fold pyridoxal phosphate-dependent enzyme n=1 Tax=Streptomyces sp. NPDC059455 TaxID=3346837 RepID=UPI0036BCF57B